MNSDYAKQKVRSFWDEQTCGTQFTQSEKFSKQYFDDIESDRYTKEPEILEFADFENSKGKVVLEVGTGAATDFMQWAKYCQELYGVDLTPQSVQHAQKRLALYGLTAKQILVADAEQLPFANEMFDIVYSWGVIHHSPHTEQALAEIVRVLKKGGEAKIMIYNRHSILAYFFWVKHALLKGKPFKSLAWVLDNHMESKGTKGYTLKEVQNILKKHPIKIQELKTYFTYYDRMARHHKVLQWFSKLCSWILPKDKYGWFLVFKFTKE